MHAILVVCEGHPLLPSLIEGRLSMRLEVVDGWPSELQLPQLLDALEELLLGFVAKQLLMHLIPEAGRCCS